MPVMWLCDYGKCCCWGGKLCSWQMDSVFGFCSNLVVINHCLSYVAGFLQINTVFNTNHS